MEILFYAMPIFVFATKFARKNRGNKLQTLVWNWFFAVGASPFGGRGGVDFHHFRGLWRDMGGGIFAIGKKTKLN